MKLSLVLLSLITSITIASCGDNLHPLKYEDALRMWYASWCLYAERCFVVDFHLNWPDQKACEEDLITTWCSAHENECNTTYPENKERFIYECVDEMNKIVCTATDAPDSCFAALMFSGH